MTDLLTKTLILRLSSIGDIILASPLIRLLRKKFPSARIDFVVRKEFADLVRYNPNITNVYEIDTTGNSTALKNLADLLKNINYDNIIDIHNNFRTRRLRSLLNTKKSVVVNKRTWPRLMLTLFKKNIYSSVVSVADRYVETVYYLGIQNDNEGVEVFIPQEIINKATILWQAAFIRQPAHVIALCPAAKHFTKMWPPEQFAELGKQCVNDGSSVVLFGGANDEKYCERIRDLMISSGVPEEMVVNFAGKSSLLESAALMDRCEIVVANDSGLMHIAAARKRPVVGIFGPTVGEFGFFPVGTNTEILQVQGLSCRPCSHLGGQKCPKGHFRCMKEILPDRVFQSIRKLR